MLYIVKNEAAVNYNNNYLVLFYKSNLLKLSVLNNKSIKIDQIMQNRLKCNSPLKWQIFLFIFYVNSVYN